MDIKPSKNDMDYRAAPNSPEGERLDGLVMLIEAYVYSG
jgi:hypothetical protein